MVQINIEKRHLYFIVGLLVILTGIISVVAYNSSPANPAYFGHSASEISGAGFGAWEIKSSNTVYWAATDGFVVAYGNGVSYYKVKTDSNNPPNTIVMESQGAADNAARATATVPVKRNDYWKVEPFSGNIIVRWIPLGS